MNTTNKATATYKYCSRSSRKRPPREFDKAVVTGAGRLQEYALVSDQMEAKWPNRGWSLT